MPEGLSGKPVAPMAQETCGLPGQPIRSVDRQHIMASHLPWSAPLGQSQVCTPDKALALAILDVTVLLVVQVE